jgi:CheY-like chemotaxis protein
LLDAVLQRPLAFEGVMAALGRVEPEESAAAKVVAVVDCEPGAVGILRETLRPFGAEVTYLTHEEIADFCRERRPAALVLEWPLLEAGVAATLAGVRAAPGSSRLPILLLSASAREEVAKAAPDLMRAVDLVFRKPVSWEAFTKALARYLDLPALTEVRPAPPSGAGRLRAPSPTGEEARARLHERLEAKCREVEDLRSQLEERGRESERWRVQAVEADALVADLTAKVAVLEEALERAGSKVGQRARRGRP